jgi:GNAT superfamily N-acetyltransferase
VCDALRARLYDRQRYLRFTIDLRAWESTGVGSTEVEIRAGLGALVAFRESSSQTLPLEFYADRLQGARHPYLGLIDGHVGHISWMLTHGDHTRLIRLKPLEVELDFAYTFPEFRGRRLLTVVEQAILTDARRRGALTAYTHVAESNVASIRGVLKTGFRVAGTVTLRWLLGIAWRRFHPYDGPVPSVTSVPNALLR